MHSVCFTGWQPHRVPIDPSLLLDQPCACALPLDAIRDRLAAQGFPVQVSQDPGTRQIWVLGFGMSIPGLARLSQGRGLGCRCRCRRAQVSSGAVEGPGVRVWVEALGRPTAKTRVWSIHGFGVGAGATCVQLQDVGEQSKPGSPGSGLWGLSRWTSSAPMRYPWMR